MLTETTLEMHFHRPLMELFRDTFGLGTNAINFYKYSPQKECFVGFDQAFARTDLTEDDFFALLEQVAAGQPGNLPTGLFGYFLQYKVVKEMQRRSRYTPDDITNIPHYRIELSTKKNKNTGISQHELLHNLSQQPGALVYYACPMLFSKDDLYEIKVDLAKLRLADVSSCPSAYQDNDNHYVFYDEKESEPIWCSDPVVGKAITPETFFKETIAQRMSPDSRVENAKNLLENLRNVERLGLSSDLEVIRESSSKTILPIVAESLMVLTVGPKNE